MANNLFSLFDDRQKLNVNSVSSDLQSIDSISSNSQNNELILKKVKQFDEARAKIDYSDFANFVFFNSALDYFNITGEKILNEYPYDGSAANIEEYNLSLDDYQRYTLSTWPKSSGHLRFNPSSANSYISVSDLANVDGVTTSAFLSPGSNSLTLEMWCIPPQALTGSNDVMILSQKVSGSGTGYTAYLSGSQFRFMVRSASFVDEVSASFTPGETSYFACVFDRTTTAESTLSVLTGSLTKFPVEVQLINSTITEAVHAGASSFTIASGTLSGKVTIPFSGSVDDIAVWGTNRTLQDISSSFNAKTFAQDNLLALWRFNESGSNTNNQSENSVVLDYSGHKLNGTIINYFDAIRGHESLIAYEEQDPILFFGAPEIQSLVEDKQISGSLYDKLNDNIITRLLPDQFFLLEEFKNTDVLQKFIYILARQFDYIKSRIDQFSYVTKTSYGNFDQTPDALISDIGKFFGWEFTGQFLSSDATQYILGKNVLHNLDSNIEIDKKLYQIKNEFWKRVLINLMHIYKSKGTRESIESLMRVYGINKNFVRLKEYGYSQDSGISTNRISAEKSIAALGFGSASFSSSYVSSDSSIHCNIGTVEMRVRFPTESNTDITPTLSTGSLWSMNTGSVGAYKLSYVIDEASPLTGNLILAGELGQLTMSNLPIFNNSWYNISFLRDDENSLFKLNVISDEENVSYSSSVEMSALESSSLTTIASASMNLNTGCVATLAGGDIHYMVYGSGSFVVCGDYGKILTSTNGDSWTPQTSQFGLNSIYDLIYADGLFVAVGDSGIISTSPDGTNWTLRSSGLTGALVTVAHGGGLFLVGSTTGGISTSPDGITWTPQASQFSGEQVNWIIYADYTYVAVGGYGSPKISVSADGVTWFAKISTATSALNSIAYGAGFFVAGSETGELEASADGNTWTTRVSNFGSSSIMSILYKDSPSLFIASGDDGKLVTSEDATTWTLRDSQFDSADMIHDVIDMDGEFIAAGANGTVSISIDGYTWELIASSFGAGNIYKLAYADDDLTLVAAGTLGKLAVGLSDFTPTNNRTWNIFVGATGSLGAQYWCQEVRVWDVALTDSELRDHSTNFQSYGVSDVSRLDSLRLHWRLDENIVASSSGTLPSQIIDITGRKTSGDNTKASSNGSAFNFAPDVNSYKKFLNNYSYIASPDFGWNEDKIRIINSSKIKQSEAFEDNRAVSLEFNMIDALNEDISQIISTMDNFNNSLGLPVNRFRSSYHDLDVIRKSYFKRLSGRLNFTAFANMLEFFDRSFIDLVRRLIPTRSIFLGDEFVVESHMLERPKYQWNYHRQQKVLDLEGRIFIQCPFALVEKGRPENIPGDFRKIYTHVSSVCTIEQQPSDKRGLSGVFTGKRRSDRPTVPASVNISEGRFVDEFGNPILLLTGIR